MTPRLNLRNTTVKNQEKLRHITFRISGYVHLTALLCDY